MNLITESYQAQVARWPQSGRHILAQFDSDSIVVYQAYRPAIGRFAAQHGHFGGEFSFDRMSWIKPNFLWMMYRCDWGRKPDQEIILAVRLRRAALDQLLAQAVPSSFDRTLYETPEEFRTALKQSSVRLQWDPDHDPSGAPVERRAIQLGLRGDVLRCYAREWILDIQDISPFVADQRAHLNEPGWPQLATPREHVCAVSDPEGARRAGVARQE
jgi:hypothetical protein